MRLCSGRFSMWGFRNQSSQEASTNHVCACSWLLPSIPLKTRRKPTRQSVSAILVSKQSWLKEYSLVDRYGFSIGLPVHIQVLFNIDVRDDRFCWRACH